MSELRAVADEAALLRAVQDGDELALGAWADAREERGEPVPLARDVVKLLATLAEARALYDEIGGAPPWLPLRLNVSGTWSWPTFIPAALVAAPEGSLTWRPWMEANGQFLKGRSDTVRRLLWGWNEHHPLAEWLFRRLGLQRCVFEFAVAAPRSTMTAGKRHLRPHPGIPRARSRRLTLTVHPPGE